MTALGDRLSRLWRPPDEPLGYAEALERVRATEHEYVDAWIAQYFGINGTDGAAIRAKRAHPETVARLAGYRMFRVRELMRWRPSRDNAIGWADRLKAARLKVQAREAQ